MRLSSLPTCPDATAPTGELVERLRALYHDESKHAAYQSVPLFIARALGYQEEIHSVWRSDWPRYKYIAERLGPMPGEFLADIGANTGFFSLNFSQAQPRLRIAAFEMNPRHAEYITLAAAAFSLGVEVRSQSCDLSGISQLPAFDTALLLNVLHHAGFDFDRDLPDDNGSFENYAVAYLRRFRERTGRLVFQIGSNRGGDKRRPLFASDDDGRRLAWIVRTLRAAGWRITHLGYAQPEGEGVCFRDAPQEVMAAVEKGEVEGPKVAKRLAALRLDRFPGEFHRRPLVIATAR